MRFYADKEYQPARNCMSEFIGGTLPDNLVMLNFGCGYSEISGTMGKVCKSVTGIDMDRAKLY